MTTAHAPATRRLGWLGRALSGDVAILLVLALARVLLHTLTNDRYGFHRDELVTIDDARHLAWGYVAYPPLTPAVARLALELFGPSLVGLRASGYRTRPTSAPRSWTT